MWYALFDQEHLKEELLSNPKHFKIGLKSKAHIVTDDLYRSKLWKVQILALDLLWCLPDPHDTDRYFQLHGGRCGYI